MSTQAIQMIADREKTAEETPAQPHLLLYGWIYVVLGALTALAVYVILSFPQGEI